MPFFNTGGFYILSRGLTIKVGSELPPGRWSTAVHPTVQHRQSVNHQPPTTNSNTNHLTDTQVLQLLKEWPLLLDWKASYNDVTCKEDCVVVSQRAPSQPAPPWPQPSPSQPACPSPYLALNPR